LLNNVIIEIGQLDGLTSIVNCILGDVDFLQDLPQSVIQFITIISVNINDS